MQNPQVDHARIRAIATHKTMMTIAGPKPAAGKSRMKMAPLGTERGVEMEIPLDQLSVDHTYQREDIVETKVNRLAANWDWRAYGRIIVAMRPDNSFVIMEGQYRYLAAKKRGDIDSLPCTVFVVDSVAEEADVFLRINQDRKPVTAVEKFRAEIHVGDKAATAIAKMISDAGLKPAKAAGKGNVACVKALTDCWEDSATGLGAIWPLVVSLGDKAGVHNRIVKGLFYLQQKGVDCADSFFVERMNKIGQQELVDQIQRLSRAFMGGGGEKVWARAIIDRYNHGLRSNKIVIVGVND